MKNFFFGAVFAASFMMLPACYAANRDSLVDLQVGSGIQRNAEAEVSLSDGKAYAYKVSGSASIIKSGSPVEKQLKVGDLIQKGDKITTQKNAVVEIAFDILKKNAVQIPQETQATFTSIEPTDIKLDNGSVFSAIDGLAKGSSWKVTTPAAVAAVRGTVYLVRFEAASGEFFAATLNVPDDGKTSAIEIQSVTTEGNANVAEGKEITIKEGETPSQELVQTLSPEVVAEVQKFFQDVSAERGKSSESGDSTQINKGSGNGPGGPGGPNGPGSGPGSSGGTVGGANQFTSPSMQNNPISGLTGTMGANTVSGSYDGKVDSTSAVMGTMTTGETPTSGSLDGTYSPQGMTTTTDAFNFTDPGVGGTLATGTQNYFDPSGAFINGGTNSTGTNTSSTSANFQPPDPCASGTCAPPPCGNTGQPCQTSG